MTRIAVSAESAMPVSPERVYAVIADYQRHHAHILPPAFTDLAVEQGGVGAGTVIRFTMRVAGRTRTSRARIAEPRPGSVLTETDVETGLVTTFTVTPEGTGSRVRFDTVWERGGLQGLIEKLFAPRMLRGIYRDELTNLARYAASEAAGQVSVSPRPAAAERA